MSVLRPILLYIICKFFLLQSIRTLKRTNIRTQLWGRYCDCYKILQFGYFVSNPWILYPTQFTAINTDTQTDKQTYGHNCGVDIVTVIRSCNLVILCPILGYYIQHNLLQSIRTLTRTNRRTYGHTDRLGKQAMKQTGKQCNGRQCKARQGKARQGKARQGKPDGQASE